MTKEEISNDKTITKKERIIRLFKAGVDKKEIQTLAKANPGEVYNALKAAGLAGKSMPQAPSQINPTPEIKFTKGQKVNFDSPTMRGRIINAFFVRENEDGTSVVETRMGGFSPYEYTRPTNEIKDGHVEEEVAMPAPSEKATFPEATLYARFIRALKSTKKATTKELMDEFGIQDQQQMHGTAKRGDIFHKDYYMLSSMDRLGNDLRTLKVISKMWPITTTVSQKMVSNEEEGGRASEREYSVNRSVELNVQIHDKKTGEKLGSLSNGRLNFIYGAGFDALPKAAEKIGEYFRSKDPNPPIPAEADVNFSEMVAKFHQKIADKKIADKWKTEKVPAEKKQEARRKFSEWAKKSMKEIKERLAYRGFKRGHPVYWEAEQRMEVLKEYVGKLINYPVFYGYDMGYDYDVSIYQESASVTFQITASGWEIKSKNPNGMDERYGWKYFNDTAAGILARDINPILGTKFSSSGYAHSGNRVGFSVYPSKNSSSGSETPSAESGVLVGASDINGRKGILAEQPDGSPIKLGGGEIIMNEKASTKHCKTLSKINQETGGVAFDCDLQKVANTDRASGKMPKDEWHQESAASGKGSESIPARYKEMGFAHVGHMMESTQPEKKWMVLAKKGDRYKVVHGGQKGMEDFSQHKDEARRRRFWERMGGEDSEYTRDPFSPLYWHKKYGTWEAGGRTINGIASEGRKIHGFDKPVERSREYILLVIRIQKATTEAELSEIESQMNADHQAGKITDADKAWLAYQIKQKQESCGCQHKAEAGAKNENMEPLNQHIPLETIDVTGKSVREVRRILFDQPKYNDDQVVIVHAVSGDYESTLRKVRRDLYEDSNQEAIAGIKTVDIINDVRASSGYSITEADEAKDKQQALKNLEQQIREGETMGVIQMYEDAARKLGASNEEIKNARSSSSSSKKIQEGDVYNWDGVPHVVTRISGDGRVYIRREADSAIMGKMPEFWVYQKDLINSASSGTKTPTHTMNYYYLKIGNKIQEHHNGAIAYTYEIRSFKKNADGNYVAMVKEHSITPGRPTPEFEIKLDDIMSHMENKHYTIEGCTFETDRDKVLLQTEIASIINEEQGKELAAMLQDTKLRAAQAEENLGSTKANAEAIKRAADDTIAGMEAMAGGGQIRHTYDGYVHKVEFGRGGIDGLAIMHLKEWKKISSLKISHSFRFIDEQGTSWVVTRTKKNEWFFRSTDSSGLSGKVDLSNPQSSYASGKAIPNNYEGKLAGDIWDAWTIKQRMNFNDDHKAQLDKADPFATDDIYIDLPLSVQKIIREHVSAGQYSGGGQGKKFYANWASDSKPQFGKPLSSEVSAKVNLSALPNRAEVEALLDAHDLAFEEDNVPKHNPDFGDGKPTTHNYVIRTSDNVYYFVNTEGYDYPREITRLVGYEPSEEAAKGKKMKSEWLIEDEGEHRKIIVQNKRPKVGDLVTTSEEEGGKATIVSKVIGKPGRAESGAKTNDDPYKGMARKEKEQRMRTEDLIFEGAAAKVLRGRYKGQVGTVKDWDTEENQVDVKMPNGKMQHLGHEDIEILASHPSAASGTRIKKLTKKGNKWVALIPAPVAPTTTAKVPEWAKTIATHIAPGTKLIVVKGGDEYYVRKVSIPTKGVGKAEAEKLAKQIVSKIHKA